MLIVVTEEVISPCDSCDYAPSLCGNDVENCLAFGKPKTVEEQYLEDIRNESHWIHEEEQP